MTIAVVGFSCRLPGGIADAESLWAALLAGRDLVGEVPAERFDADAFVDPDPRRPGKIVTRAGGFLDRVDGFDADFFGISPREAAYVDPQQRLLLEMAVEAFDDAGIDTAALAGSAASVYVGISSADYGNLQHNDPASISAYSNVGNALSVAANRISYVFDLHGPSMAIDTACSSGLVALHEACGSLRSGESTLAIAAGVNVLLSPYPFVGFSKAMMLSAHGRSAAFGSAADGYVRAEGGGLVVLKPLEAALADGDRIHAVIRGTAVNSDGRTVGLSLPNADAQKALLQGVYRDAGVAPDELAYFEAHGTGTPTGDPIECRAIGEALACARTQPLPIGSIKTNVGHLEPASGLAGLVKALLVLRHREIPPSLHGLPANPAIDFRGLKLAPVNERTACPANGPLVVGVNSFGFGGTNAHAILASAPPPPERTSNGKPPSVLRPLVVSARSERALAVAARRLADVVAGADDGRLYDLCYTACLRRTRHAYGFAALGSSGAELATQLRTFAQGDGLRGGATGTALRAGRIAFVFSGNGSQWAGMGADLWEIEPHFRATLEQLNALLAPKLGWSVVDELRAAPAASRLHLTEVAQPLLFAVQLGIVAVLEERGIVPEAVTGHSVGEVAAAYVAGAFDLETAVRVIVERSRAQAPTRGIGAMAAIGLSHADTLSALAPYDSLEVSAINSRSDVTVSGDAAALARLAGDLQPRGVFFRRLDLDYAFHSLAMDPIADGLRASLDGITTRRAERTFVSTVTGAPLGDAVLDAEYWWRNIRAPVQFAAAIEELIANGIDAFVEIGPHAVLDPYLKRLTVQTDNAVVIPTLKRGESGPAALATATARLLGCGATIAWDRFFPHRGHVADLPAYPWQRERYWNGEPGWWDRTAGSGAIEHPLLGRRLPSLDPTWQGTLEPARPPWLVDHLVGETIVLPGTGHVEIALASGRRAFGSAVELVAIEFAKPVTVPPHGATTIQASMSLDDGSFRIASQIPETGEWQLHVTGRAQKLLAPEPKPVALDQIRARLSRQLSAAEHYQDIGSIGLPYGPAFTVLEEIALGNGEGVARYRVGEARTDYEADPTILDGALQLMRPVAMAAGSSGLYLPSAIGRVRRWHAPPPSGFIHMRMRVATEREVVGSVVLFDESGTVTVALEECRFRRFDQIGSTAPQQLVHVMRAAPDAGDADDVRPETRPSIFAGEIRAAAEELKGRFHMALHYERYQPRADALCAHFAAAALERIWPGGEPFDLVALHARGVAARYGRLIDALLAILEADGFVQRVDGERWRLVRAGRPEELFAKMVSDFPAYVAELTLLGRCGGRLADVLLDRVDPLELIFPDEGAATAEHLYDSAPFARFYNHLIAAVVRHVARAWPADRPLRVFEIGAGTGGTTAAVLPELPPERTRYTFTDLSDAFLVRAAERFSAYDIVEYRRFDVECAPGEQGVDEGAYDVVIAANVLHATADVQQTLRNAATLLAPGGLLVGLEVHDQRSLTLVFGLLDGWWRSADTALRPRSPLLSAANWPAELTRAGFDQVELFNDAEPGTPTQHSVIVARRPGSSQAARRAERTVPGELWIVVAEGGADAVASAALARALRERGATAIRAFPLSEAAPQDEDVAALAFDRRDEWRALVEASAGRPGAVRVALLLGAGADPLESTLTRAETIRALAAALTILPYDCTLALVARANGSLPAPDRPDEPAHAAIWAVLRSLANEQPRLAVRRLAVAGDRPVDAGRIAAELMSPSDEDEVVLTAGGRFVPRVVPLADPRVDVALPSVLELRNPGSGYELAWVESGVPQPGAGEVAIAVASVGMNYKDVLLATGRLGLEAVEGGYCGPRMGIECAGTIVAVGPDVRAFAPGDRVYAVARSSFSSHLVAAVDLVGRVPDGMSFAEAATLATVFMTVHYGLHDLARLKAGETILIHGAAGGVGLAAVQYAQHVGAHIIATAGFVDKREFLGLLGVEHVLDSRSLDFAEQAMDLTGGRGVDVVLNSLAGEALRRNLDVLRPFGRMVELGKRDFFANGRVGLRPFRNNISFFGVDIDQLLLEEPAMRAGLFAEVERRIHAGTYRPLPFRTYPASRVHEAFMLLRRSRHVGKVVVTLEDTFPVEPRRAPLRLDPEGTYLVVGGTGGFGAGAARWLAERGARRLALVSRRGAAHPEAARTLAALAQHGAQATAHAVDVADLAAMEALVHEIDRSGKPLRGVVHAAMVLDDAALADLSPERFRAVLAPKLQGGVVLDRVTSGHALDLFVVFSSATTLFGNPGQANYVAGNAFLEALVRKRRAAGLPGLAVAWGAIGDVGYVARNADLAETVRQLGVRELAPSEAFDVLDDLLARGADVAAVGRFDWGRIAQVLPVLATPRFSRLAVQGGETRFGDRDLRKLVVGLDAADASELVEGLVAELVAGIVRVPASQLDRGRLLADLGMDSLMAIELRTAVENQFGFDVPAIELTGAGSVRDLARLLATRLVPA